jgi:glucokinase
MAKKDSKKSHPRPHLTLGIDLGGTKILAAVVDETGRIIGTSKRKTRAERGVDEVIDRITKTAVEAVEDAHLDLSAIEAAGIGAPGVADHHTGVLEFAPNLPDWVNIPLGLRLEQALGVPVFVENDVNAGTYGEATAGAARDYDSVVGVFPGTGIGGGIVLNGALWRGARNAAAELGHMVVMIDGPLCGCGRRGCIEALAARTAIERDIWGEIRGGRRSIIEEDTPHGEAITSGTIARALGEGDAVVSDVMGRACYHLGIFTAAVVNAIDPACVVYGGGLIEACADFMLPIIRDAAYRYLIRPVDPQKLPIVAAELGDNATVVGGAMLAQAALNEREEE